ncbi:MAG: pyridoxamine 5'-phosphate oxidase [Bacteroidetes bacterium]|jgi:pyridoxamine 5'-phosphate oxidase|nr:pyridoxamine 5'-phosphate oxidase [Bacteroidota bacterium]
MTNPDPRNDLAALRKEYRLHRLSELDAEPDPLRQFERWFDEATAAGEAEPNAMILATSTTDGRPSARVVLLKRADAQGFQLFTNTSSRKGDELSANPHAALVFFWPLLERQVRIEGRVEELTRSESAAYFASRPRESRIGAWVSQQSSIIPSRESLERAMEEATRRFGDGEIPLPDHWGGYRVIPERIEFWQGRENRLHDRILYQRAADGWNVGRLSP